MCDVHCSFYGNNNPTKKLLRSAIFIFVQLWCLLSLIFLSAFVDSDKKDDDGRLVQCSKCHKPYKSLPRLQNHTMKCNRNHLEWNHLEQNCNNEPALNSAQREISSMIQTSMNHSMNAVQQELKPGPPPLIHVVQQNNLDPVETFAVLSQPGYLQRTSLVRKESPITKLPDTEMSTSVLGHSQEVKGSSHPHTNGLQGSPYQQRSLIYPVVMKESQTVVSNGKHRETVPETQQSINGSVRQSSNMYPHPSSNAQSRQDTTDNSIRRSSDSEHTCRQLSVLLPPDANLSPTNKNKETTKDGIIGRMKKNSEGKWGKIKSKFRKRAQLAEQRRIKKLLTVQTGAKPFACNICKRSFSKMIRAKRHVMTHLGVRPFKCTVCYKTFNQAQTLKDHAKFHKSQESKQRETYSEKKRVYSLQNALGNIATIELEEVPEETEKIIQAQIEEAGKPYKCGTCPMQFSKYAELEKHIAEHRAHNPVQPYKCGTCPMQFFKYIELEKHIAEHRARNPIQCNVCSRSLISREMLDQHLRWHREREHFFPCDQCPKTFYHLEGLKEHVVQCHKSGTEAPPFQSKARPHESSNVSSSTSSHGNQPCHHENGHVGSLHLSQGMSAQAAKFYFPNSPFMPTYHENIDSMSTISGSKRPKDGEEPTLQKQQISFKLQKIQMNASSMIEIKTKAPRRYFKCTICTSTFYKDSEFNKHMLEHEEGMTFTCMACDITFSTSSELNRHYATHPGKNIFSGIN